MSISLEMIGDRWSLLIVRDMMVRGLRTYNDFLHSGEGIATNILSDRLRRLQQCGIVTAEKDAARAGKPGYRLTEKGIDLAPVLLELLIWGARHEPSGISCAAVEQMAADRGAVLEEARRRWKESDSRPLLPGGPLFASRKKTGRERTEAGRGVAKEAAKAVAGKDRRRS